MQTLLWSLLLVALATAADAQPRLGETWQDTITRKQFEEQLDRDRRERGAENWRLHMDHQGQDDRLDELKRRFDRLPNGDER